MLHAKCLKRLICFFCDARFLKKSFITLCIYIFVLSQSISRPKCFPTTLTRKGESIKVNLDMLLCVCKIPRQFVTDFALASLCSFKPEDVIFDFLIKLLYIVEFFRAENNFFFCNRSFQFVLNIFNFTQKMFFVLLLIYSRYIRTFLLFSLIFFTPIWDWKESFKLKSLSDCQKSV